LEACATAHRWARELAALGHDVRLMPPGYVKAYVKRNKNDAADAEAICEAVTRPSMRFVPVKTADQQSVLMLRRARGLLVRQRTMLVNALRAYMAEFGIVAAQGLRHVEDLIGQLAHEQQRLPELARSILHVIVAQLNDTMARVHDIEVRLVRWHRNSPTSRLLATVPGIGIMGATAFAATVSDPSLFRSGREFAAWLGMTPRQNSSGGKERLDAPASAATNISAASSFPVPSRCCVTRAIERRRMPHGCAGCSRDDRRKSPPLRLPTSLHGLPGRSWHAAKLRQVHPCLLARSSVHSS
jgi:transposase